MLLATLWFYVAALLGCATIETKTATPLPRTGSGTLLVGAKKSDLTPIPGYPMGGHAIGGRYGLGAMGPLHVRALYLEDPTGTPLILVALDVWAVSPGLRDMVVQLLQDSHGLTHIGPDHVVLSASHTHHSSAAFATENALNLGGGVSPSFSRVLFDRTAARIAQAIADAHDLRRPAAVHHGAKPIQNYARNRSLTPFLDNAEASTILAQNPFPPSCTLPQLPPYRDAPVPESCRAVDPRLRILKFTDARDDSLIAAAVFANVHNTTMPNTAEFYHADFFGLAANRVEVSCGEDCVVGVFNGAEGDVSPTWRVQSLDALHRAAAQLEAGILDLLAKASATPLSEGFEIYAGWFPMNGAGLIGAPSGPPTTADRHALGCPALGGAEDGVVAHNARSRRKQEGARRKKPTEDGHGVKIKSAFQLSKRLMDPSAPVQVIRLGGKDGFTLVTLPGEVTTVVGHRVKEAVATLGPTDDHVLVVGLANAYKGYFTTPEEYVHQEYEGAQTWWGEAQAEILIDRVACLARARNAQSCLGASTTLENVYRPGQVIEHGLHHRRVEPYLLARAQQSTEDLMVRAGEDQPRANIVWSFQQPAPDWEVDTTNTSPIPRVLVERHVGPCRWEPLTVDGYPEDDALARIITMVTEIERRVWTWRSRWFFSDRAPSDATVRLRTQGTDGASVCSESFKVGDSPTRSVASAPCICAERDEVNL